MAAVAPTARSRRREMAIAPRTMGRRRWLGALELCTELGVSFRGLADHLARP